MSQAIPTVSSDISDTMRTNYVGFASFVILIWDHIDTFPDEVEYIWKRKKGIFVYLFLFNRYFTPLGFIINLFAYLSPVWTLERCSHFVRYEGCTVAIAVEVVGVMMLLRVNALYPHHKWIGGGLLLILVFETLVNGWLISRGEPVIHNPNSGIHACSMIFDPSISGAASASAWIPLLYDTLVFGLTLYRTVPPIYREEASYIIKRLLEDGILYYSVIFSVTFVLTFMIVAAPPGTKNIAAQMEQLVTVAMMSRITIHLKRAGDRVRPSTAFSSPNIVFFNHERRPRPPSSRFRDHRFDTSMPEPRFSADQTPPPSSPNIIDDMAERVSTDDLIHQPLPLVIAQPKIRDIQIV